MNQQFDLLQKPWLLCISLTGERRELSLRDLLLSAHELSELYSDSPLVTASLYRFLLAVLYAIYQPQERANWQTIWQKKQFEPEAVDAYFNQSHIRHRFDLFHETHPFYQTTEQIGKPLSLAALMPERAGGNNATLFDHSTDDQFLLTSLSEAARLIITAQAFSLGGGNSGIKGKNFTDAPCSRGVLCFAEGQNLFETLVLNLIPYDWQEDAFTSSGLPAWEMESPIEDERKIPDDLLDYLTWQSRRLNFAYENETLVVFRSQALSLDKDAIRFDPLKPYYFKDEKKGHKPVRLSKDRALWRDSYALFRIPQKEHRPALVFDWLALLCRNGDLPKSAKYQFLIFGLATEPGKATMYFSRLERIPLPLTLTIKPELMIDLDTALSLAEDVQLCVRDANRRIGMYLYLSSPEMIKWGKVDDNTKKRINDWIKHTGAEQYYWTNSEPLFHKFIVMLSEDRDKAIQTWRTRLHRIALTAFEQAAQYAGNDGRSFKAVVKGRSYLNYRLNQLIPKEEEMDE